MLTYVGIATLGVFIMLHTTKFAILQGQYHGVQDIMTTPWPLTLITHNMTKIKTQLRTYI